MHKRAQAHSYPLTLPPRKKLKSSNANEVKYGGLFFVYYSKMDHGYKPLFPQNWVGEGRGGRLYLWSLLTIPLLRQQKIHCHMSAPWLFWNTLARRPFVRTKVELASWVDPHFRRLPPLTVYELLGGVSKGGVQRSKGGPIVQRGGPPPPFEL